MESTGNVLSDVPSPSSGNNTPIKVTPHPAETVLRFLLFFIGVVLWVLIVISILGIPYGFIIGGMFFFAHLSLIANLRGNCIKLSPQQLPKLYNRVARISRRIGLEKVPDAYLMQSGGVLNAFATRFGFRNFIVLYSDIVRSCGSNMDALDFIIGHELGHLHRGHLKWRWLKAPAHFIPFLGSAYSRACEYTCDSYGKYACTDPNKTSDSLCLLACGASFAPIINRQAFVAQSNDLNTVFMKLGTWMMSHPPLAKRIAKIDTSLRPIETESNFLATMGAFLIAAFLFVAPIAAGGWFVKTIVHDAQVGIIKMKEQHYISTQKTDENGVPEPERVTP